VPEHAPHVAAEPERGDQARHREAQQGPGHRPGGAREPGRGEHHRGVRDVDQVAELPGRRPVRLLGGRGRRRALQQRRRTASETTTDRSRSETSARCAAATVAWNTPAKALDPSPAETADTNTGRTAVEATDVPARSFTSFCASASRTSSSCNAEVATCAKPSASASVAADHQATASSASRTTPRAASTAASRGRARLIASAPPHDGRRGPRRPWSSGGAGGGYSRPPLLSVDRRLRGPDRDHRQQHQHRGDDVHHRRLVRAEQVAEDPDRQRLQAGEIVNVVTTISSKLSANAEQAAGQQRRAQLRERHPAERQERVRAEVARRLLQRRPVRRSRASTLLCTSTMQNVACPMITVRYPNGTPPAVNARVERDAGDDAGQRDRQDDEEADDVPPEEPVPLDGERQHRAEHQRDRRRAAATTTLVSAASRTPALDAARRHHSSVKPAGGQPNVRDELTEFTRTTSSGT
jgi:hypothetical protein